VGVGGSRIGVSQEPVREGSGRKGKVGMDLGQVRLVALSSYNAMQDRV
jgi:hypothetical protein